MEEKRHEKRCKKAESLHKECMEIKKSNSICISHAVDSGIFNLPGRSVYHFIVLFLYKSLHVEGAGMGGIG